MRQGAHPQGVLRLQIVYTQETDVDGSDSVIQQLFGLGLHTRLVCAESEETIEEDSTVYELKCNITVDVNHLTEGIRLGLQDDREKNSEKLGRLALYAVGVLTIVLGSYVFTRTGDLSWFVLVAG